MKNTIDVFISHHTNTCLKTVEAIVNHLEMQGIRCWYAPRDVRGMYAGDIVEAIKQCKVFVLVLNYQSSASQDVLNEIEIAMGRLRRGENIAILAFQISNDIISNDAQYYTSRWYKIEAINPPIEERIYELGIRVQTLLKDWTRGVAISSPEQRQLLEMTLRSTEILPNNHFVCREKELEELHASLEIYNKIFVQGIGGIGKSELVKAYALKNKKSYQTIVFATYQTTLKELLIYDEGFCLDGFSRRYDQDGTLESDESFFERKLKKIQSICDEKTLIIIDNFDTQDDPGLESFLKGPYTVIFTTRNDFEDLGLPCLFIQELNGETEQMKLFSHYFRRPILPEKEPVIKEILTAVNGHTLAIELIAKLMFMKRILPEKMLEILNESGIKSLDQGAVSHGFAKAQSVYENIHSLFGVYALSAEERKILMNLSLMPLTGIEFVKFAELCDMEDCTEIDNLIKKSWIRYDYARDMISLHPLIRDVVRKECEVTLEKCEILVRNLSEKLKQLWAITQKEKLCYTGIGKSIYEMFPKVRLEFAETYEWIGVAFKLQEQCEISLKIYEDCMECYREAYGENSSQVAHIYYRLGDAESYRGRSEASVDYLQTSVELFEETMPNTEKLAYVIKYLCWILLGCSDDYPRIEKLLHRSNEILRKQEPKNLSQIASQDSAYANLYYFLGQYERALDYAEKSYEIFNKLHGEIHGDTLAPMGIKARIISKMGRGEEAVDLALKVIEIQKRLQGEKSNKVLLRCEHLAEIYKNIGQDAKEKETLVEILGVLREKRDDTSDRYRRVVARLEQIGVKTS